MVMLGIVVAIVIVLSLSHLDAFATTPRVQLLFRSSMH
jgi:hypothetical protein